jgi:arabinogalactan endo-1,4-beta-galactosidase
VRGVRTATTAADSVRVMLHYSGGANQAGTQWFFDLVQAQGVTFDLIGFSYYPWWHGNTQQLRDNLNAAAQRYAKDIMIVETSYPWRDDWTPSGALPNPWAWARTPDGQRSFLRDIIAAVDGIPNARGKGVVWWYPEAVSVPGLFVWGGGSLALFDANGVILPAADLFRTTNTGRQ